MGKFNINNGGVDTNKAMPNIDERYGPYNSFDEANAALGGSGRNVIVAGLTVGIRKPDGSVKDYVYQPNEKGQLELVEKQKDGITPYIDDTTKEWMIGEKHTGVDAEGKSAYQLYVDSVPSGQTPMTEQQWLASLKGDKGDAGHNPNLGYYIYDGTSYSPSLPSSGVAGDYIVIVDTDADPQTATKYVYNSTYSGDTAPWKPTEVEANDADFASGEKVIETSIDDTHLANPVEGTLAKAKDVVTYVNDAIHTHEEVEFSSSALTGFTQVKTGSTPLTIGASVANLNKWIAAGKSAYHEVVPGEIYKLEVGSTSQNARYAFLKDIDGIAANASVHLSEETDLPHVTVYSGSPVVVTIPSDTHYLWKTLTNSSAQAQTLNGYKGTVTEVKGLSERVDDVEQQLTGFDYSSEDVSITTEYKKNSTRGYYSTSTNAWYAPYTQTETDFYSTRVEVGSAEYVQFLGFVKIGVGTSVGYAFEDSNGNLLGDVFKFRVEDSSDAHSTDYAEEYTVKVPDGAYYFVFPMKYNEVVTSSNRYCKLVVGESVAMAISNLEDEVEKAKNSSAISLTHLIPDNKGQLNAVKRMRKFTDIRWTPAFDFSRGASGGGESYFKDKFLEGVEYKGIPYGRSWYQVYQSGNKLDGNTTKNYGYPNNEGFKVGTRISLETFITAICNKGTVMELESRFNRVAHDSSFYANICAGSVTAALGSAYYTTNDLDTQNGGVAPNVSGFSQLGRIGSTFADLAQLKLGDVLAKYGVHTAMVTDVIIEKGDVKYIEISESTTQGNSNYNKLGGVLGGVARRLWWSAEDFLASWDDYKILRYTSIASVQYTPCPYVPMADEQEGYAPHMMACLPYMGNGFRYVASAPALADILKIVVTVKGESNRDVDGKQHLRIMFKGVGDDTYTSIGVKDVDYSDWQEDGYLHISLTEQSDGDTYKQVGDYQAYLYNDGESVGEEVKKTSKCKWSVVSSITNLEDY